LVLLAGLSPPSTSATKDDSPRPLGVKLHRLCAKDSHSDSSRWRSGSPPWDLGATEVGRHQAAAKIAWNSTRTCAMYVSARVFANRAAARGSAAPSKRIPPGSQGCGRALPQVRHRRPHRFSSCYTQHWGIATGKDGRTTMPTLDCLESKPHARRPCPEGSSVPYNYKR
jgi:hypothetical protein